MEGGESVTGELPITSPSLDVSTEPSLNSVAPRTKATRSNIEVFPPDIHFEVRRRDSKLMRNYAMVVTAWRGATNKSHHGDGDGDGDGGGDSAY